MIHQCTTTNKNGVVKLHYVLPNLADVGKTTIVGMVVLQILVYPGIYVYT